MIYVEPRNRVSACLVLENGGRWPLQDRHQHAAPAVVGDVTADGRCWSGGEAVGRAGIVGMIRVATFAHRTLHYGHCNNL